MDRNKPDDDDQELSKIRGQDPYPWLEKDDPR